MHNHNHDHDIEFKQISWQCRRGMLELDNILIDFLHTQYHDLSRSMQQNFHYLVQQSDPDLLDWFLGKNLPTDHALRDLILLINKSASILEI